MPLDADTLLEVLLETILYVKDSGIPAVLDSCCIPHPVQVEFDVCATVNSDQDILANDILPDTDLRVIRWFESIFIVVEVSDNFLYR